MSEIKLPKDWKIVYLKSISDSIQYGYTESSSKAEIGPKFLRITDIQENKVNWESVPYCKIDKESIRKYLLKEGDLVFARTGATVGKSFLIKGKIPEAVFASYLIRVRVNLEINEKYLSYFFQSPEYWKQITNDQVGTGQPNVNGTKLGLLKIVIAPLETQQAIVAKIEELFSELDKGIEDLKTAQQQLKTYRQSVLKWAFEGKLTNENVKDGELPESWGIMKFGELFSESPQNGLYKSSTEYGEGTPIIRIDGFYDGVILDDYQIKKVKLTEEEINRYLISIGDILVNRVNSMPYLGKCGLVKHLNERTVFESNIMKIRVNKENAIPEYISKFLTSKKGLSELRKNAKQAVNQASINQTDVSNVLIPLPQPNEQRLIVQELESRLSVADKMEESIAQSLQQAEALRQSILKKAFSGELI